jgi:hypothetical protein
MSRIGRRQFVIAAGVIFAVPSMGLRVDELIG